VLVAYCSVYLSSVGSSFVHLLCLSVVTGAGACPMSVVVVCYFLADRCHAGLLFLCWCWFVLTDCVFGSRCPFFVLPVAAPVNILACLFRYSVSSCTCLVGSLRSIPCLSVVVVRGVFVVLAGAVPMLSLLLVLLWNLFA